MASTSISIIIDLYFSKKKKAYMKGKNEQTTTSLQQKGVVQKRSGR